MPRLVFDFFFLIVSWRVESTREVVVHFYVHFMTDSGLAIVYRKASDYPYLFSGWFAEICAGIEELCIGALLFLFDCSFR